MKKIYNNFCVTVSNGKNTLVVLQTSAKQKVL